MINYEQALILYCPIDPDFLRDHQPLMGDIFTCYESCDNKMLFDYNNLKFETVCCCCCGEFNCTKILGQDRYGMGVNTVICNNCGLVFTNPMPTDDSLEYFYKKHYRNFYETTENPDSDYIEKGRFIEKANYLLLHLKPYLGKNNKILDLGCSEGSVLKVLCEFFFYNLNGNAELVGVEPNVNYAKYAQNNLDADIVNSMVGDFFLKSSKKFDVIIMNHTLEHFRDPNIVLEEVSKRVCDGGYVYVEVPNLEYNNLGIWFFHIAHLYHFTPYTLERLALKFGLVPVYRKMSSNAIHKWAMVYVFKKIDISVVNLQISESYVAFIKNHVAMIDMNRIQKLLIRKLGVA